jgi:major membrane immunogen (membrane-anchored lipoprotein)
MRKTTAVVVILLLMSMVLVGCGTKTYRDGTYTGQSGKDDNGAYGEVTLVIKDDKISACQYVTWQQDGSIKDEDYGKVNGEISNKDFYEKAQLAVLAMRQYAEQLPQVQRPEKVDAVSGATIAYDQFNEAVYAALAAAGK